MATAPFAVLESRLNLVAVQRLANATWHAVVNTCCGARFDNAYAQGSLSAPTAWPAASRCSPWPPQTCPPPRWALLWWWVPPSYLVAAHQPDGTGVSRLLLEAAA
jgi:hypothetical protein